MEPIRAVQWLFRALFLGICVPFLSAPTASAVTRDWEGDTSTNYSTGGNWSGNTVPGASDTAQFSNQFTGSNQPQLTGNVTLGQILFASNLAKTVTLSASSGTMTLNGLSTVGIDNQSSGYSLLISAPLRLGANQTWQGNTMTISGNVNTDARTLTLNPSASNTFTLSGAISGTGAVIQSGTGTVVYSGSSANTYSGATTVNAGELQLNKSSGNAIAGGLTIGDGTGTDIVRLMNSNQINDSTNVTVNSSGQLLFNGAYTDTVNSLTLTGGTVNTGAGNLTLSGNPAITSNASSNTATIAGNLTIQQNRTISVADGAAAIDLDITANILDKWYTRLTKTGAGTLRLSGNNTFEGPFTISGGTVIAASNGALGTSNWNNEVASGAALHLSGGITLNEGSFEIAGTGPDGLGAIRSIAGNNTYNGTLVTTGASTIGIDSGTGLTLNGPMSISHATTISNSGTFLLSGTQLSLGADLTVAGSGNSTFSSGQITGSGNIIKTGSGTLLINGSGLFSINALNIQEGTVELNRDFTPDATTGIVIGTTSGPAATLRLLSDNHLLNGKNGQMIEIRESGLFDLNNKNDSIAGLSLYGGTVNTGTGTLTLANAGGDVIKSFASTQVATINGKIQLAQDNLQEVTIDVANSALTTELNLNAAISQLNPMIQTLLVKEGAGTLEFSGTAANTYTGVTRVDAGTLMLNKTASVDAIAGGRVEVNSGGTLLLASANQINNSVNMTLNGGTFSSGTTTGFSDTLGTLTLSANSVIDLGSGVHWLVFAASNATTWNGSATLTINDWVGVAQQSGTQGRIYFGNSVSGLTSAQLAQISFTGFGVGAMLLADGELVPIPEADVILVACLILLILVWREREAINRLLSTLRTSGRLT